MLPFHPATMLRPQIARASAPLALVIALLPGCGAASSASPNKGHVSPLPSGTATAEDKPPPPPPEEPSFMRVGTFESPVAAAATAAPIMPITTAPPPNEKQKLPNKTTTTPPTGTGARTDTSAEGGDPNLAQQGGKKVEGAVVDPKGGLSEADVRAAISEKRSSFRTCYDLGVKDAADFSGSVTLRVAISPAGNVASADIVQSSTRNAAVDACVRDEVRRLVFKTTGAGAVVAFPIEFGR